MDDFTRLQAAAFQEQEGQTAFHLCKRAECGQPVMNARNVYCSYVCRMADTCKRRVYVPVATPRSNQPYKLQPADVMAIRQRFLATKDTYAQMAETYGVSEVAIWKVVNRKTWKHLP